MSRRDVTSSAKSLEVDLANWFRRSISALLTSLLALPVVRAWHCSVRVKSNLACLTHMSQTHSEEWRAGEDWQTYILKGAVLGAQLTTTNEGSVSEPASVW